MPVLCSGGRARLDLALALSLRAPFEACFDLKACSAASAWAYASAADLCPPWLVVEQCVWVDKGGPRVSELTRSTATAPNADRIPPPLTDRVNLCLLEMEFEGGIPCNHVLQQEPRSGGPALPLRAPATPSQKTRGGTK